MTRSDINDLIPALVRDFLLKVKLIRVYPEMVDVDYSLIFF
jgi:hypothetical protein